MVSDTALWSLGAQKGAQQPPVPTTPVPNHQATLPLRQMGHLCHFFLLVGSQLSKPKTQQSHFSREKKTLLHCSSQAHLCLDSLRISSSSELWGCISLWLPAQVTILTAPERMQWLGLSRNSTQLWPYLVVKVNSDAVKSNIA